MKCSRCPAELGTLFTIHIPKVNREYVICKNCLLKEYIDLVVKFEALTTPRP